MALLQEQLAGSRRVQGHVWNGRVLFVYAEVNIVFRGAITMAHAPGKQANKNVSKLSVGGIGPGGLGSLPPAMPLASPLMGKKKKPFLGMAAPLGYVPGLGRG